MGWIENSFSACQNAGQCGFTQLPVCTRCLCVFVLESAKGGMKGRGKTATYIIAILVLILGVHDDAIDRCTFLCGVEPLYDDVCLFVAGGSSSLGCILCLCLQ